MRKLLVAATLTTMILVPSAAHAGFLIEASLGKGYQVSPAPTAGNSRWEQLNLNIAPGWAPSLPVLSMLHLQLGIVTDFADKSGSKTTLELRPTLSLVPPILPIYGRVMVVITDVLGRYEGKREYPFGAAVGARIGLPSIGIIPSMGVFAEVGALPRQREFLNSTATGTESKFAWVLEGRVGAYLNF
jgi:hypothetical protein